MTFLIQKTQQPFHTRFNTLINWISIGSIHFYICLVFILSFHIYLYPFWPIFFGCKVTVAGTSNVGPHGGRGGGKGDPLAAGLSRRWCVVRRRRDRGWRESRRKREGRRRRRRRFGERTQGRKAVCVFVVLKEKTGRTSSKRRETGEKVCGRKNRER